MSKVFGYELRRLLFNKFFFGLLAVTMFYSYLVMDSEIVLGDRQHRAVFGLELRGFPDVCPAAAADYHAFLHYISIFAK